MPTRSNSCSSVPLHLLLVILHIGESDLGPAFLLILQQEGTAGEKDRRPIEIPRHAGAVRLDETLDDARLLRNANWLINTLAPPKAKRKKA